jgi:thiol:disulfide interchange protein
MALPPSMSYRRDDDDACDRRGPTSNFNAGVGRALTLLIIGGVLFAAWRLSAPATASAWYDNVDDAITAAQQKGKPILAYFTADWCGPCQQFKKDVLTDGNVKSTLESKYVLVKIDLTQGTGESARVAQKLGIRSIPTFITYNADGQQIDTLSGGMPAAQFNRWLEGCAAKAQ